MATSGHTDGRVLIKRCEAYDRDILLHLIQEGMRELDYLPSGKVFVKPNVAFAGKDARYGTTAWTHSSVVGASLLALSQCPAVTRTELGENMGIGFPTRMSYKYAGYYEEMRQVRKTAGGPVGIFCIDEAPREEVFVGGYVHSTLRVARKMARADTKVYLPKLKCHCVTVMTGAVKLNMGICSDDERAIRHDFLLNDKIVDLLVPGYPDFIVMDAVEVGVGNEVVPAARKLGLILMGRNPLAVDLVGARLLGYSIEDVPHLKRAVERGYAPVSVDEVVLLGDITGVEGLDAQAKRLMPYDDEFHRWHDIGRELERLHSPLRFVWGPSRPEDKGKCPSGCVMGLKMFFAILERHAGAEAFRKAHPAVFVIGHPEEEIDARGCDVFLVGSCSHAAVVNAHKVIWIDRCFTTVTDLIRIIGRKLGIRGPLYDPSLFFSFVYYAVFAAMKKVVTLRYFEDIAYFLKKGLLHRI